MSNTLPPGVVPKLRRVKVNGKEVGTWYIVLDGKKVRMETTDYMLARDRAKEATETGRREFPREDRNPVKALPPMPTNGVKHFPQESPSKPANWADDIASAVSGGPMPEPPKEDVKPDGYYPPGSVLPPIEKPSAANAPGDAPKPDDDSTTLPPEMLEELLETAASMLVQMQLDAQAYLIRRMAKREPAVLDERNETRIGATKIWKDYLKTAVPANVPLPPYLVAPLLIVSFGATEQIAKSTPLEKKDVKPQ